MPITVELSSENTDKYFKRFSLKEKYKEHPVECVYIFPKEKEMLKYWKYRKCIKYEEIIHVNILSINRITTASEYILFFDTENQFIDKVDNYNYTSLTECLVFEFPDDMEDDAFYFQMKYC